MSKRFHGPKLLKKMSNHMMTTLFTDNDVDNGCKVIIIIIIIMIISSINATRLPFYHRLSIGLVWQNCKQMHASNNK